MLRKLFYLVSVFIVVGLIGPATAQDADMEIGFAVQPPVLDGEVDEIWADASEQSFVPLEDPANGSGTWKVLYDADNLYVLVDITDDSLHNDSDGSWQDDSVEIYFDGGNTKLNTPLAGDDHQYTFGWTTEEIQGTNIDGYTEGIEHAQVDTDSGWRIEVKMPWLSIWGVAPQAGDLIGIDCYYNDDDDGGDSREGKMLSFSAVEGWNDASQWATAVLAAIPEPAGPKIIWVSDNKGDDRTDQDWIDLLVAEGYDVNLDFSNQEARSFEEGEIEALNAADLIIISRDTNSGDYDDGDEPEQWNAVTTPIIMQVAHIARSSRWRWLDTTGVPDIQPVLEAVLPEHPIFQGVTLDPNNQVDMLTTLTSFPETLDPGNGTLIAKSDAYAWIVEWEQGQEFYPGSGQIAGGNRLLFVSGGTPGALDGILNLTEEGVTMFLNAVNYMIPVVPETILVDPNSDLAAANELAQPGDTIEFAAGTYYITSQIEIKDGVTYRGAGPGLTIIDGADTTRAFVAWGDRSYNEDNENANDSGPKGWVLEGMTIQNCVADTNDRFSYTGASFNLKANFATLDADVSGGLDPNEANDQVGGIRLAGEDGTEGTEDDDLHRFAHIDTDGSGEISEAELDAQLLLQEDEFGDQAGDGGAVFIGNQAVGTIQNCEFLNNHTPAEGAGDDGGAVNITGLSVITINDCLFDGNYAVSKESVAVDGSDGDGGHIKVQGNSASALTPGTTLIANRCVFLNGNASDDGGAIQSSSVGTVVRLDSCRFEANTSWDNGNVCQFMNNTQNEVTVTNCIFVNNVTKADNSPDRMIETNRNSKFINCTFVGNNQEDQDLIYNNANVADTDGDGVDDETADVTQVINCIFVNNVIGNGDDVLGARDENFAIAATNCLFFGNTRQNGKAADNTQLPDLETASVEADPLLDADYVPAAGSPAIDAGIDPAAVGVTLLTDYIGTARPQGAAYDIGAFEVEAEPPAEQ